MCVSDWTLLPSKQPIKKSASCVFTGDVDEMSYSNVVTKSRDETKLSASTEALVHDDVVEFVRCLHLT